MDRQLREEVIECMNLFVSIHTAMRWVGLSLLGLSYASHWCCGKFARISMLAVPINFFPTYMPLMFNTVFKSLIASPF